MKKLAWFAALGAGLALVVTEAAREGAAAQGQDVKLVALSEKGARLEFTPPAGAAGELQVELCNLEGKVLARAAQAMGGAPAGVALDAELDPKAPASYYLRYRFGAESEWIQKSLFFLTRVLETIVLGQRDYLAGTRPELRILVRDRAAGQPVADAAVTLSLADDQGKELFRREARTNPQGEAPIAMELPDREAALRLKIEVDAGTAADVVEETIQVKSGARTLLTTDKPMYQPGQTIHMRALSLARPALSPLARAECVFEVEDSKGNKVFKRAVTSDEYGITSADFVLAEELNQGAYRIRHLAGGAKEEKTVTVERYVLPKFKVNFTSDRTFYRPGEAVKGEIQADYFFGKPVAGGQVRVVCSKFDVEYVEFQTIDGKTDDAGHYAFEVKLPEQFVGQPIEAGKASAKFDITLIDTADHREAVTRNVTVTANPILIGVVPEAGDLIAGLENKLYVVTTYADASPAPCRVTWADPPAGGPLTVETDAGGFAELSVTPAAGSAVKLSLAARDEKGNAGSAAVELTPRAEKGDDRVLLRTGRALYRVGDDVELTVSSTRRSGSVYVDVIKDRQTWLSRTLALHDGLARDRLSLDATLSGTLEISAYVIGGNGVIVRDRRLVVVDPANDLRVEVSANEETYLPGGEATLSFRVTNPAGRGVASALGVMVVDEAVFALQEMQPGLEKVYFYLEKEIATPRYEIHGHEIDEVMPLRAEAKDGDAPRREQAARVLLAAAKGTGDYGISVNTYDRDSKGSAFEDKMQEALAGAYGRIMKAMGEYGQKHKDEMKKAAKKEITLDDLVMDGQLKRREIEDPWGHAMKISGTLCESCMSYHDLTLLSAGIDGAWDTADDVTMSPERVARRDGIGGGQILRAMAKGEDRDAMAMPEAAAPDMMVLSQNAPESGAGAGGAEATAAPRIRQFFPETLYFNPAVLTDGRGLASLTVPMADSITTWRLTCMASSLKGALGSATSGIRVFQDFFVDVDFPVSLTQNDQVWVPVAVYNYLAVDQQVKLVAEKADWFDLKGEAEQIVTLKPSEVKAVYFPITVKGIGFQKFTVFGYGAKKSDAVSRAVELVPDGKEHLVTFSGRLEGKIAHEIEIPAGAIAGASKIFVKVYPGVLSQVIEGLDGMLRMPSGCFEQTSSATYPNVLVLDYMKTTGKVTPELQMKAEGFINSGYQRLLAYEVQGGGFEWFGNAPAHRILTAYGLMEFYDMSKVFEVDPAVISRTQTWLAKCQEADGSFKPSAGGIQEGAINKFTDDVLRTTAYITWGLAHTGYAGPETAKGVEYIRKHQSEFKDVFTLALAANALVTAAPKDADTLKVLQALFDRRTEEGDMVYWKAESETATHGRGDSADIEVTGLAVQAFVSAGRELGAIGKAVGYLARKKDAFGTWESTQATIQALRAMLMAERGATQVSKARIALAMNGQAVQTLTVDETNSDVLQLVDLKDRTQTGKNTVELAFEGEGGLMYQVVGRYYLPRPAAEAAHAEEPMTITVEYDRTKLVAEDVLTVTATATFNRPGRAKMVILDLGLPPGFTLIPDRLNAMVAEKSIQKYDVTGRQIIVYLDELTSGKPVKIAYQLLAKYPLKAKTAPSAAYEYYDPGSRAEAKPVELEVSAK